MSLTIRIGNDDGTVLAESAMPDATAGPDRIHMVVG